MTDRDALTAPTMRLAIKIAGDVTGYVPIEARRFETGMRHYVFEVEFASRQPVVVRMGAESAETEIAGAVRLSKMLRPSGVPLPEMLAWHLGVGPPWMVLERLPGTDLGAVIRTLSSEQLEGIASRVAGAQAITAKTGSAGRYGYASRPDEAPYATWAKVLEANLTRSQGRISSAGIFDGSWVDVVRTAVARRRDEIDRFEAIPFLHDTTTKNVIVAPDGEFSGIVDVDDLCFGDPRYPAALTLAVLLAYGGPTEYVSAWLRHARESDDSVFRLYVLIFLLDLMSEHGQTFNGNERPWPSEARSSLRRAFENGLRLI
jgi:aminoglycoside phosphotransferase (APT) family kinase protein